MSNIYIEETYTRQDPPTCEPDGSEIPHNITMGSSGIVESWTDNPGKLYRSLLREHGRCISKIYIDTDQPNSPQHIGYVFVKRRQYDDCDKTYLAETWCTFHQSPPTTTTQYHYLPMKG